jgi:hypothetical protein
MGTRFLCLLTLTGLCSCGTFSSLRPADNLKQGEVEIVGGISANTLVEVLPVGRLTVGITDWLEAGVQTEVYSNLADVRFGILGSEENGIALSVGVQGGTVQHLTSVDYSTSGGVRRVFSDASGAVGPTLCIGRRWDFFELYMGAKALSDFDNQAILALLSGRLGARFRVWQNGILGIEAGGSGHFWSGSGTGVGEATAYLGFSI